MKSHHAAVEHMGHDGFETIDREVPSPVGVGYKALEHEFQVRNQVLFVLPPGDRGARNVCIDQLLIQGNGKITNGQTTLFTVGLHHILKRLFHHYSLSTSSCAIKVIGLYIYRVFCQVNGTKKAFANTMLVMTQTTPPTPAFKDFFLEFFRAWEDKQPNKRTTYTAFANWLSENSFGVTIKQQLVSYWMKGDYEPTDEKFIYALAEKLGEEVYEILQVKKPNILSLYTNRNFDKAPKKIQVEIVKTLSKYSGEPIPEEPANGAPPKSK